ncbi:MAG TPA: MoxR family ATPase [Planctomycetaceae bacterium]|nr:MoxR family ATPase [Planctomycetaceae bacterium]
MTANLFDPDLKTPLPLPAQDSWPASTHRFELKSVWAVRAAIASGRPLLLRGEPGIGKSQLARAVAEHLQVPFLHHVVDERSERDELLYTYDAVARLAEAQVSALSAKADPGNWKQKLKERNFFRPGVLWWAFNWNDAAKQAAEFSKHCRECKAPKTPGNWTSASDRVCGPVVLIDEIDKADPSVPNGLLESLGNQGFQTAQLGDTIGLADGAKPPLVIITTNEERELPAAFLRRCLVLQMLFPTDSAKAETFLIHERARVHWKADQVSDAICKEIVQQLMAERSDSRQSGMAIPGAAEFLDILHVLVKLCPGDDVKQREALKQVSEFALKKNLEEQP